MRYGIKYGGTIFVGSVGYVARQAERWHGEYRLMGEPVVGGWAQLVEPVNEEVLDLLRDDYTVIEEEK